jgi:uncharacterized membrane protein YphA (DoxX/SURF4 family)
MMPKNCAKITLNEAGQTTLRMLIASYFIAAAIGSIPGADTGVLFAAFLPGPMDQIVGASLVFLLATMVLIGAKTRLAALLLAILTFYASYVHLIQIGAELALGTFWRDMALIAALMLTYGCDRASAREVLDVEPEPNHPGTAWRREDMRRSRRQIPLAVPASDDSGPINIFAEDHDPDERHA